MFVSQNVDYLLDELCCCHMVTILGRADEMVTHFLLISLLGCILSRVGLEMNKKEKKYIILYVSEGITAVYRANKKTNLQYATN